MLIGNVFFSKLTYNEERDDKVATGTVTSDMSVEAV